MTDWRQHAACRDFPPERIDVVWFSPPNADYSEALDTCAGCPVTNECGERGRGEKWGVWGGRTPKQRGVTDPDVPGVTRAQQLRRNPVMRTCTRCGTEFEKVTLRQRVCGTNKCHNTQEKRSA